MSKVLITGNPNYGVAMALKGIFPNASFFSRNENNFDLTNPEKVQEFANRSLDFDVFINNSCLYKFHQIQLLEVVYKKWVEQKHSGYIISIGSTADTPVKGTAWLYPIEKKALRSFCRNLSLASLGGHGNQPSGIRITYLSPGYIDTQSANTKHPLVKKIDPKYIANVIKWLIDQPAQINISELCLDPIQT